MNRHGNVTEEHPVHHQRDKRMQPQECPPSFETGENKNENCREREEDLWGPGLAYLSGTTSFGGIFVTHMMEGH